MKMENIMWNDPLVEELHQQRQEHAKRFGFEVAKIFAHYRAQQRRPSRAGAKVVEAASATAVKVKRAPRRRAPTGA